MFKTSSSRPCIILAAAATYFTTSTPQAAVAQAAVAQAAPAPAASASQAAIPEGTLVHLSLLKDLKSGGSKGGEDVPFEVSQDVYGPGHVLLIAANTPAFGKILESSRRGMFGKSGKLKFTIDYILAPDKTHILLRSDPQLVRGKDNRTAAIATAILLAPIAILINGHDVSVKKGELFTMYVNAPALAQSPNTDTPPAPQATPAPRTLPPVVPASAVAAPAQSVFVFANGAQAVGTLLSFDGSSYTVSTTKGMRQFKKAAIISIRPLAPATVTAANVGK